MVVYADDTTLFVNMDNNVDEHVINNELCKISEWLGANKLSLNISKTKFIIFHQIDLSLIQFCKWIEGRLKEWLNLTSWV